MKTITGAITKSKLAAWMEAERPALALYETDGARGFYRRDAGPASSFQVCGSRWADVAARLGARDAKGE